MISDSIVKLFSHKIPYNLKNKISSGRFGIVYELDDDKVIKVAKIPSHYFNDEVSKESIIEMYNSLIDSDYSYIVKVFDFKEIYLNKKDLFFYSVMEKCYPLNFDEVNSFKELFIKNNNKELLCMNMFHKFYYDYNNSNFIQFDLHSNNVMKSKGCLKLIDLESVRRK